MQMQMQVQAQILCTNNPIHRGLTQILKESVCLHVYSPFVLFATKLVQASLTSICLHTRRLSPLIATSLGASTHWNACLHLSSPCCAYLCRHRFCAASTMWMAVDASKSHMQLLPYNKCSISNTWRVVTASSNPFQAI